MVLPNYTNHLAYHFQVTTISNHCWLPSLLDSPTDILLRGSYNVPLTLACMTQASQHVGAILQSHLFGTEMKTLILCLEEQGETQGDQTRVGGVMRCHFFFPHV